MPAWRQQSSNFRRSLPYCQHAAVFYRSTTSAYVDFAVETAVNVLVLTFPTAIPAADGLMQSQLPSRVLKKCLAIRIAMGFCFLRDGSG